MPQSLSDAKARNAKPRAKKYKMSDGEGLFLVIMPSGSKYWRLRYFFAGKEKLLALGVYPEISLADAPSGVPRPNGCLRREMTRPMPKGRLSAYRSREMLIRLRRLRENGMKKENTNGPALRESISFLASNGMYFRESA